MSRKRVLFCITAYLFIAMLTFGGCGGGGKGGDDNLEADLWDGDLFPKILMFSQPT